LSLNPLPGNFKDKTSKPILHSDGSVSYIKPGDGWAYMTKTVPQEDLENILPEYKFQILMHFKKKGNPHDSR
jgi:hypothetical protein